MGRRTKKIRKRKPLILTPIVHSKKKNADSSMLIAPGYPSDIRQKLERKRKQLMIDMNNKYINYHNKMQKKLETKRKELMDNMDNTYIQYHNNLIQKWEQAKRKEPKRQSTKLNIKNLHKFKKERKKNKQNKNQQKGIKQNPEDGWNNRVIWW